MSAGLTDRSLIARIRSGDEAAAKELYDRYARRVFGLVRSQMAEHLRSQVEPEDIVQSVFKSIFRGVNAGGYDAPEGGTLWQLLAVIAVHKVRRNANRRAAARRDDRRTQSLEAVADGQLAGTLATEQMEAALREAIECLKPFEQSVVMLRVQGYSVEEISGRLERSRRTVERSLQNARRTLADLLELRG